MTGIPQGRGLLAFKNVTVDPHNSHALRLVFTEKVTTVHKAQLLSALQSWVTAQKLIQQHGGVPTPEEAVAMVKANRT